MSNSSVPAFVAPILEGFAQTTHPIFVLLLESTFFTALLVPVLLSLLYFSTPTSRRTLVWNLVVSLVIIGLGSGAYSMHMMSQPFVDPLHSAVLTKSIPIVALWSIIPWLVDCVLLIRVISVYPPRPGKIVSFIGLITLPIALKIARLCLTSLFLVSYSHAVRTANLNIGGGSEAEILSGAHSKLPKGDWVLQLVDNAYMSGFFLWRLRNGFKDRVKTGHWDSLTARLRTLFWIAASNFVIPVLFNIVLLAIPFPSLNAIYVQLANVYVTLIAVVFATVWSGSQARSAESTPDPSRSDPNAPISAVKWTPSVNPGHYALHKYDHGVINIGSEHTSSAAPPTLVNSSPRYEPRSFLPDRKMKV